MFGDWLLQLLHWLGPWKLLLGCMAVFYGVLFGTLYRTSEGAKHRRMTEAARGKRFCRDCRWAVPETKYGDAEDVTWRYARCLHPTSREKPENFLITGTDNLADMAYCSSARSCGYGWSLQGRCGPRGRYWERGQQVIAPPSADAAEPYNLTDAVQMINQLLPDQPLNTPR